MVCLLPVFLSLWLLLLENSSDSGSPVPNPTRISCYPHFVIISEERLRYYTGVSTGFGGSVDTRILETDSIQSAIVQELHCGVWNIPKSLENLSLTSPLPLSATFIYMPESWVRAEMPLCFNALSFECPGAPSRLGSKYAGPPEK